MLLEPILLHEEPLKGEMPQLVDILENVLIGRLVILEEFAEEASSDGVVLGHGSE